MSVFRIPKSNPLSFVRTDAQAPVDYRTVDNMKLEVKRFGNETKIDYFQKFAIGDSILIQFHSDYSTIVVELFDNDNVLISTLTQLTAYEFTDSSGIKFIDVYIDTTLLGGLYYVKIAASGDGRPTLEFLSNPFEVGDYSLLPHLSYTLKEKNGVYYGLNEIFEVRFEGWAWEVDFEYSDEAYQGYNNAIQLLKSDVARIFKVKTDNLSFEFAQTLVLALSHRTINLNGILVGRKGKVKLAPVEGTNLYTVEADLQDALFEDYTQLIDQGGTPATQGELSWDDNGNPIVYDDSNNPIITF